MAAESPTAAPPVSGLGAVSARRLAAAPHRLMFFIGVSNVLLGMTWWAAWMIHMRWPMAFAMPYPPAFPGWLHAFVMQYQMIPSFIFGFLLTTFPKWTNQPEVDRRRFVPVGLGMIGGQLATLAGALTSHAVLVAGVALTLAGWTAALAVLVPIGVRERGPAWHARSCVVALVLGYAGLASFGAHVLGASPAWALAAIKIGTFGLLLPVFFTAAHRLFPFFAGNVVAGYLPWRPPWLLAAIWPPALLHVALELVNASRWLWIADAPLVVVTSIAWFRWWPRGAKPGLLAVLFQALTWLPIAMALYTVDDLAHAVTQAHVLGRAPAHALFVGFFTSTFIAMITRVTQGHSGRALEMPAVAWFAFLAIQLVAVSRIVGELAPDPYAWFVAASIGWLIALAPWVVRLGRIYLTPRVDQKPG